MPVIRIDDLSMNVESEDAARRFLESLDLIMSLYELPRANGKYEYTIEENGGTPPREMGTRRNHIA